MIYLGCIRVSFCAGLFFPPSRVRPAAGLSSCCLTAVYFYLNQLEPKLALTAFLSTEAGVLVGVNYYRTTDFLCQHLKKIIETERREKEGSEKAINIPTVFRNPRNTSWHCVVCAPVEYFVGLFEFSVSFQIRSFFSFLFPV